MRLLALLAACAAVSGCSTLGGGNSNFSELVLENLRECSRDYTITFTPIPQGTIRAQCEPQSTVKARAAAADPVADLLADPAQ